MAGEPRRVSFYSEGYRLAGLLFLPDTGRPCPGIVVPLGTNSLKEQYNGPLMAATLANNGFAALRFDYRGLGESEGPPDRLVPAEQVADVRDALTYLTTLPEIDASRLGLLGYCWGGSIAISTAAVDPRVKCVVVVGAMGDGMRWLRNLRPYWEWRDFLARIESDRRQRVLTGKSEPVRFGEILVGSPMAKEGKRRIVEATAGMCAPYRNPDAILQTAERILEYRPEEVVGRIAPRPLLVIHGDADDLTPLDEGEGLYRAAGEPKKLIVLPGAYHHDVYIEPLFSHVLTHAVDWFKSALGVTVDVAARGSTRLADDAVGIRGLAGTVSRETGGTKSS